MVFHAFAKPRREDRSQASGMIKGSGMEMLTVHQWVDASGNANRPDGPATTRKSGGSTGRSRIILQGGLGFHEDTGVSVDWIGGCSKKFVNPG